MCQAPVCSYPPVESKVPGTSLSPVKTFPPQNVSTGGKEPSTYRLLPAGREKGPTTSCRTITLKKKFPCYHRWKALVERRFYPIDRIRSESDLMLTFFCGQFTYANEVGYLRTRLSELHLLILESGSRYQRASLGIHFRIWDPRFRNLDPKIALAIVSACAKYLPPGQKLPSGHPLEGVSHSAQNYNFERF